MTYKYRWGIVGTGYICGAFAEALSYVPGSELYAVGSRTKESSEKFAQKYRVSVAHGSYRELIEDPNVDIVYIGTVNSCHKENCICAIDAGKPILCEKPFMLNNNEAKMVIAYAEEKKVFLMEALWTQFIPAFKEARQLWEGGAIGELFYAVSEISFIHERNSSDRLYDPSLGGGSLLDIGIYPVTIAQIVFGEPDSIASIGFIGPTGVDEQTGVLFGYKEGQIAIGYSGFNVSTPIEATIFGSKGSIRLHAPFYCPPGFTLQMNGQVPQVFNMPYEGNGWNYEAVEVMECLQNGKLESAIVPHSESLALMKTMDQIRNAIGLKFPTEK